MENNRYIINIKKTFSKDVVVVANSAKEARAYAEKAYKQELIEFHESDCVSSECSATDVPCPYYWGSEATVLLKDHILYLHYSGRGYSYKLYDTKCNPVNPPFIQGEIESTVLNFNEELQGILEKLGLADEEIVCQYNGDVVDKLLNPNMLYLVANTEE